MGLPLSLFGPGLQAGLRLACVSALLVCAAGQGAGSVVGALLKKQLHDAEQAATKRYDPGYNATFWEVMKPFKAAWPVEPFEAVDHSHNWCDTQDRILRGELSYKDALRGQQVSVLFANTRVPGAVQFDESSSEIGGGMSVEVFKEIAKRAGFSWKETAAVADYIDTHSNQTNDDWLSWAVEYYDVVDWHAITTHRRQLGLNFAYPFVDTSINLISSFKVREANFFHRLWLCLAPFSPGLWLLIVTGLLVSASVYMLLESRGELKDRKTRLQSLGHSFFFTCGQCTAGAGFAPETPAGKTFVMSLSFMAMVLVTAFTAHLADVMVVDTTMTPSVSSVEHAQQLGKPVCVVKGSIYQELLTGRYPNLMYREVPSTFEKLRDVETSKCAAGVVGDFTWEVMSKISFFNPECNIELIGRPIMSLGGSFVSKTTSRRCKELVTDVMTMVMHQMYLEGFFEFVKDMVFDETQDIYCSEYKQGLSSGGQMQPRHFEGVFTAHYMVGFICVLISLYQGRMKLPRFTMRMGRDASLPLPREQPSDPSR